MKESIKWQIKDSKKVERSGRLAWELRQASGTRILQLMRERENLRTHEDLAFEIGSTNETVRRWCCGDTLPDTVNLIKISLIFGVTTDWLLGLTDERQKPKGGETECL